MYYIKTGICENVKLKKKKSAAAGAQTKKDIGSLRSKQNNRPK